MNLKFIIPSVLIAGAAGVLAFETMKNNDRPSDRDQFIVRIVQQVLESLHYDPKELNDDYSKEVFEKYLNDLDGEKKVFLQSDIDYLKQYETRIDDEILGKEPLDFMRQTDSIFDLRLDETEKLYPVILDHPFQFTLNDSFQLDRNKVDYPADTAERKAVWHAMLKYRTLDKLTELQEEQEKAVDTASIKKQSLEALEQTAREKVKKIYNLYFDRLRSHLTDEDRFSLFMNAIAETMDPHTEYFAPLDKRYFDEQMSGTFFGIGALLRQDDNFVKIESIVTGGPAWKQGELKPGDVILKVGQGDEEPLDLTGFTTEDAVKIIRGGKGTVVKLTVKHVDGTTQTVAITRGEVKIEDTFARSYLINHDNHKIGYIVLPEFYFNKTGMTGPGSSAYDMAQEIKKLKAVGVEGIILDLRYNGGGSLGDAIDIAGLFIPDGPVVQVRSRDGEVNVLKDHHADVAYDGPLAIMVNEYSASASEILAAAMQDYHRAVIIGSPATFGKGTVQRMFDLDDLLKKDLQQKLGKLGSLKLTIQKFYRINGGSTQLRGVASDIVLKDPYYDVAERTDKDALAWDQIKKADYALWKDPVNVSYLKHANDVRMDSNKAFKMINANMEVLKRINENKVVPLNLEQYKAMQERNNKELKRIDEVKDLFTPLNIQNLRVDVANIHSDSIRSGRNRDLLQAYRTDPYLQEATEVMKDMITLPSLQNGKLTRSGEPKDK